MGKTSLLELNSVNMSYSSTKETIINELEKCFLLQLKDPWYNIRTISSSLTREETMDDFWSLGISYHGKEEIWFVKVPANGHSILKQLGHKPRTPHMRRGKNEFVSQRSYIFSIMPIMHSSILKSLVKLRSKSMLMCPSPVEFPLLTICLCINHKLLKELSTIKERWLRTISHMKTIGIVASIRDHLWVSTFFPISLPCILPLFSKLSPIDWNSWMPPILPLWKQQNIMKSRIWRTVLADLFKLSSSCP